MTAGVVMCACGHAERMHERDDAAEHGRGLCMHSSCGCSELRWALPAAVGTPPREEPLPDPVEHPPVELPPAEERAPLEIVCPAEGCDETFETGHKLGAHKRHAHPELSKPAQPPARQVETDVVEELPAPSEPVVSSDDPSRYSIHAHIELGEAGWVDLQISDANRTTASEFLHIVDEFIQTKADAPKAAS